MKGRAGGDHRPAARAITLASASSANMGISALRLARHPYKCLTTIRSSGIRPQHAAKVPKQPDGNSHQLVSLDDLFREDAHLALTWTPTMCPLGPSWAQGPLSRPCGPNRTVTIVRAHCGFIARGVAHREAKLDEGDPRPLLTPHGNHAARGQFLSNYLIISYLSVT
jgi:hypothetical protein